MIDSMLMVGPGKSEMFLGSDLPQCVKSFETDVPFSYQHPPSLLRIRHSRPSNIKKAFYGVKLRSPRHSSDRGVSPSEYDSRFNEYLMCLSVEGSNRFATRCFSQTEDRQYDGSKEFTEMDMDRTETVDMKTFTVEEAIQVVGFGPYQGWLLLYAGMAWTAEAMEMMLLSFVGPALKDVWNLSPREESFITSVVFVGMMIGAYSWGFLSDAKGRRFGFFATSVLTFIAGLMSAFSSNYVILLVLRGLVGVGLGGGPVISTWFMEFVPSASRGLWMIIMSLFWTLGSVLEALLAWNVMPGLGWRWLLGLSSLPLAVLLLFYNITPESPRYLAAKGDLKNATDVLQRMACRNKKSLPRGSLVSSSSAIVEAKEMKQRKFSYKQQSYKDMDGQQVAQLLPESSLVIKVAMKQRSTMTGFPILSKFLVLLSPPVIRSTLLLWSVFFANAFTYYGLVLLSTQLSGGAGSFAADLSGQLSPEAVGGTLYQDVLITSLAELPGLGIAASIVDLYGRKRSMAGLFALCGVFMLPLMQQQDEMLTTALLFGARASIMGAFTVLYIYAPEVYPTSLRSTGLGIANSFARVGGLLCPLVAVDLVRSSQRSIAVGLFVAVPMFAAILVLNFPRETKGRALSDSLGEL